MATQTRRTATDDDSRIAVIGLGAVFPGASDLDTYWQNIIDGVDSITEVPPDRWDRTFYDPEVTSPARFYCNRGGFVDARAIFDPTEFGIMPVSVDTAEPDQLLALRAASQALASAGNPHQRVPKDRIGVILGRGGYLTAGLARLDARVRIAEQLMTSLREILPEVDDLALEQVRDAVNRHLGPEHPEAAIDLVPNLTASRTANRLDIHGPAYTVDAACASSLIAVDNAVRELNSHRCDLVIAGGVHHCHDVTLWSVFTQLKALSASQEIRPLDTGADGLLIGEGTGVLVLKRLEDAVRDGDPIFACIAGTGISSDGRGSLMKPSSDGQMIALRHAWQQARLDPSNIGLLEAHGTATPAGDEAELITIRRFFGERTPGQPLAGIGSVKSMIGHAMPAAGAAGMIKAVLAVHHGILPPTLHCEDPNPLLLSSAFRPVQASEPWSDDAATRLAGVNAFGFGGINAHVVIEQAPGGARQRSKPDRGARQPSDRDTQSPGDNSNPGPGRLLRLAAHTTEDLLQALDAYARSINSDNDTENSLTVAGDETGGLRIAIIDANQRKIELARRAIERGVPWSGRNDVWFAPDRMLLHRGKIVFAFPGVEPIFEPRLNDLIAHFNLERFGFRSYDEPGDARDANDTTRAGSLAREPSGSAGGLSGLERHGRDIIAVGRMLDAALARIGIRPDIVVGHSIGEWSGMISTEMIPRSEIDAFIDSLGLGTLEVPGVVFAAAACSATDASRAIAGIQDVAISHDNCPHQSVICGSEDGIRASIERLRDMKVLAQVLPFRSGFHSAMFKEFLPPFISHTARLPLQKPRVPLWSSTTCAPYPDDPDEIRALVARHLVEPVRFREMTANIHEAGGRVFIQVGTGSLPGFINDTLRDKDHVALSSNSPKTSGLSQLLRVACAVWVQGGQPLFERLFEPDLDAASQALANSGIHDTLASRPRASTLSSSQSPPDAGVHDTSHQLRLGAPLIHLENVKLTNMGGVDLISIPSDPLLAEMTAVIQDAVTASREVVACWRSRSIGVETKDSATDRAASSDPSAADRAPYARPEKQGLQTETHPGPRQITTKLTVSVDTMPALLDHCFYRQPDHWRSVSDRYPVVPMTALVDIMASAAAAMIPDCVIVAVKSVRAMRWLVADPPTEVEVRAMIEEPYRVQVSIAGYARATFIFAREYPRPPQLVDAALTNESSAEINASQLYRDRWLFHGPSYQGVVELGNVATDGIRGTLEALDAPGALLDNAGQLMGYWIMTSVEIDRLGLPTSIEHIRYFGPSPRPGERLECTVRIREIAAHQVRADLELYQRDRLWGLIEGWVDRRFESDPVVWPVLIYPETSLISQMRPGGYSFAVEHWTTSASRDLMMRRYLSEAEREQYGARNPRAQREWLLGRIAVKDAVRHWLFQHGSGPIFPVEIAVSNDASGQPHVSGPFTEELCVSIAHTQWAAVAIVSTAAQVGIDVEKVQDQSERFAEMTLADSERELYERKGRETRQHWLTRIWTAKEAVAKSVGTGLAGRPRSFAATEMDADRLLVNDVWVRTEQVGDFIVAWTCDEPASSQVSPNNDNEDGYA
jgi:phosphopantetheine--protein transferase-like protein